MERVLVAINGGNGSAKGSPHAVVVNPRRHHQNEHLVLADFPGGHDLNLHGAIRRPVALLPYAPGIHGLRHMPQGRNFADFVEVLERGRNRRGHAAAPEN